MGAEVGSIFVEFKDVKGAKLGRTQVNGRIYDGSQVKAIYVPESFYLDYLVKGDWKTFTVFLLYNTQGILKQY